MTWTCKCGYEWTVFENEPCPKCGHYERLAWEKIKFQLLQEAKRAWAAEPMDREE
jgi:hypothetical protein